MRTGFWNPLVFLKMKLVQTQNGVIRFHHFRKLNFAQVIIRKQEQVNTDKSFMLTPFILTRARTHPLESRPNFVSLS